jgi:hypothetical protein
MLCLNLLKKIDKKDYNNSFSLNVYNVLLIILASFIAGLGLLYNSTPAILGSMLISSLSAPLITSIIFFISNSYLKSLAKILNFIILVMICLVISVMIGYVNRSFSILKTPTPEMLSRITYTHVVIDVGLALLSGVCLALSVVNSDLLTKTGVSLILSFTPPLVNFGIFYGEIIYYYIKRHTEDIEEKEKEILDKKMDKLADDGNKSFILFLLNVIAMYATLLLTLVILCKN